MNRTFTNKEVKSGYIAGWISFGVVFLIGMLLGWLFLGGCK